MADFLVLSDGSVFPGKAFGAPAEAVGEVVFNTGMTGYQEVLTDPSYAGQVVVFTYPLIGNYGINDDDFESERLQPVGIVVREACRHPSNWRSTMTLSQLLAERGVPGIEGIDTRAVTQRIRTGGAVMGAIASGDPQQALDRLRTATAYDDVDFVGEVTTRATYAWGIEGRESVDEPLPYRARVVVVDCGLKYNTLRRFAALGVRSIVVPANTSADEILGWDPDGVVFSPGPGDPMHLREVVDTARALLGVKPLFGICLGNQVLARAVGARTFKLPFGHRGSNHPVKDLRDGTVTITSQNHGYAVDPGSLDGTGARVTQLNLNDGTIEGIEIADADATSIQYHPEAAPGPWDSRRYFAEFVDRILARRT